MNNNYVNNYKLSNGETLIVELDSNVLFFSIGNNVNIVHLKDIVRLSGNLVNKKKDTYSIFIHTSDGHFFQADNMFSFDNYGEYQDCYEILSTYLIKYNS